MKTNLSTPITNSSEAATFILSLILNGEMFHPEDDAHDIIWGDCKEPTDEEKDILNMRMEQIYSNTDMDPCGFCIDTEKYIHFIDNEMKATADEKVLIKLQLDRASMRFLMAAQTKDYNIN